MAGGYRVELPKSVSKSLERTPHNLLERIYARLKSLGDDPRPHGAIQLKGDPPGWRLRVGDYRILYDVDDAAKLVTVRAFGHWREVYRTRG